MRESIKSDDCEGKVSSVYKAMLEPVLCQKLREKIPAGDGEQNWLAEQVLHMPASTLSAILNGNRPFPAWLAVAADRAFNQTVLSDTIRSLSESGPHVAKPIDPRTLEKLFVLILREEGHLNTILAQGIFNHFQTEDDINHLDAELNKLTRFVLAIRERIQAHRVELRNGGGR